VDQTATADAQIAATQQAIEATATADFESTATQIAAATATQQAVLVIAESTANARATGTQAALNQTATASAATPVPPPDFRAVYDGDQFVLVNISGRSLDVTGLIFESKRGDSTRRFEARTWASLTNLAQVRPGGCLQVVTGPATQITPARADCPTFLGWFRVGTDERYFWVSDRAADTFTVSLEGQPTPFVTCTIGDGDCTFALPPLGPRPGG
jgi:hypothetical protein